MELNISRRHVSSYPENHPIITASLEKVTQLHDQLLQSGPQITIGIAKDSLMIGNGFLDRKNQVNLDFARTLFSHGIATITFIKGLAKSELLHFNQIVSCKKEAIRDQGGLLHVLEGAGVTHIQVEEISFAYFHTSENLETDSNSAEEASPFLPWENFVQGLLCGTLDPDGIRTMAGDEFDPTALAALINELYKENISCPESISSQAIESLIDEIKQAKNFSQQRDLALDSLCLFIAQLNPELRRLFLTGAFHSVSADAPLAEDIVSRFPDQLLFQALDDVSTERCYAPPLVLDLLRKLSYSTETARKVPAPACCSLPTPDHMSDKLKLIFREDHSDNFIPKDYQQTLRAMIATDGMTVVDQQESESLRNILSGHNIEAQTSAIILEIIRLSPDAERMEVLANSLADLCNYFLEIGDFDSLLKIHHDMTEPLPVFSEPRFMEEILKCPELWGKGKYGDIQQLIRKIGSTFTIPLLNHLADETNMSLRRFFMDCIVELGEVARDEVLSRLRDKRWYFVRNLLLILRSLNDPTVVRHIKPLLNHTHPTIRQETLKTMLHFHDLEADRLLLSELESRDNDSLLASVQLAEFSKHPDVCRKLLILLKKGGVFSFDLDIKIAAVRSLAEIGNHEVLPELEKILGSKNIIWSTMHNRLKVEIIRSLERYPKEAGLPLLENAAHSESEELSKLASELLKSMRGRGK